MLEVVPGTEQVLWEGYCCCVYSSSCISLPSSFSTIYSHYY